ncbi:MAG: glycosyltransferase family 4 protein [Desulfobacteraceae bacterium]|nr:glycosyltransferase family 4 protein [Desulfobacteraceae bacterium]
MKILHVIGQRPEKTGSGIYLQAIAHESEKHGHFNYMVAGVPLDDIPDLTCISRECCQYVQFGSDHRSDDHLGFPVTGMSDVMPYNSSLFMELKDDRLADYKTAFSRILQKAADLYQPDIIHTHHLLVLTALTRKLFPHLPIVTTCHGTDLRQYNNCDHLRDFVKKYCRRLDGIIALTNDQKANIIRLYDISPDKISAIGGGYDETIFNRTPKSLNNKVHILYAGKFNRSKGVPWLLRSLADIKDHDWHLHMAGSGKGSEYDECMVLAKKLGEKVTIHGYVTQHQLSALMKKAHIQVLPSFFEGLPLVLLEGLASGCRIITTNLSGFTEIFGAVKRETVDLIQLPPLKTIDRPFSKDEAWLEKELCQKINQMIGRVKEHPDCNDKQADKIALDYTWEQVFNRIFSVYQAVIQKKHANPDK